MSGGHGQLDGCGVATHAAGMWLMVRLAALVVLLGVGLLVVGAGPRLVDLVTDATTAVGRDVTPPRASGLDLWSLASGAALGTLAALAAPARRLIRQVDTLLHELGHTLVAAAVGARPSGIVVRHDASGHATARWTHRGSPLRRLQLALVAFVGLWAPAAAAAAALALLVVAGPEPVLVGAAAAGLLVGVLARSGWSLLVALAFAGAAVGALQDAVAPYATGVVVTIGVAVSIRTVLDAGTALGRPLQAGDDARVAARHVHLPARFVQALQVAVSAALVGRTGWVLTVAGTG